MSSTIICVLAICERLPVLAVCLSLGGASAGRGVVKSSAGYDLAHLIVGSEGTLATITELTVRLWQMPPAIASAVCTFPSLQELVACAAAVASGAPVAKMEMVDEVTMRAVCCSPLMHKFCKDVLRLRSFPGCISANSHIPRVVCV